MELEGAGRRQALVTPASTSASSAAARLSSPLGNSLCTACADHINNALRDSYVLAGVCAAAAASSFLDVCTCICMHTRTCTFICLRCSWLFHRVYVNIRLRGRWGRAVVVTGAVAVVAVAVVVFGSGGGWADDHPRPVAASVSWQVSLSVCLSVCLCCCLAACLSTLYHMYIQEVRVRVHVHVRVRVRVRVRVSVCDSM
jgi:hypothetical protein